MKIHPTLFFSLAALLTSPMVARCAAIMVNTKCVVGSCSSPDTLLQGQANYGILSTGFSFANGDTFSISGQYSTFYGGGLFLNPLVTYVGNSITGGKSAGTDVLTIEILQNSFSSSASNWDGTYYETISVINFAGSGSTVQSERWFNGQSTGVLGPFGPGPHSAGMSSTMTGLTGNTLAADEKLVFTFAAGLTVGQGISVTPEPATAFLGGLALVAVIAGAVWRKRRMLAFGPDF